MKTQPTARQTPALLDDDFLMRLERLRRLMRRKGRGPHHGEHLGLRSGASLEFLDYRSYQPGDDPRYIDWNVYGRLDKLNIKLFRAEENRTVHLLLDASASMAFGGGGKLTTARKLAAAVGYLALCNQDSVRLSAFGGGSGEDLSTGRSSRSYPLVLDYLGRLRAGGSDDPADRLLAFARTCTGRSGVVVIGDLLTAGDLAPALKALKACRAQVMIVQVLDPLELSPNWTGDCRLTDLESGEVLPLTIDNQVRQDYRRQVDAYVENVRSLCLAYGHAYTRCVAGRPLEPVLTAMLMPHAVQAFGE